jgi:hypothetical protein
MQPDQHGNNMLEILDERLNHPIKKTQPFSFNFPYTLNSCIKNFFLRPFYEDFFSDTIVFWSALVNFLRSLCEREL